MTPSRNAQGQMSNVERPSRRMVTSATTAPASNWCARLALTPSISASPADRMCRRKPSTWCSPIRVSWRRCRGPAADGAAPASRASVRNVFEVATGRSQPPSRMRTAAGSRVLSA